MSGRLSETDARGGRWNVLMIEWTCLSHCLLTYEMPFRTLSFYKFILFVQSFTFPGCYILHLRVIPSPLSQALCPVNVQSFRSQGVTFSTGGYSLSKLHPVRTFHFSMVLLSPIRPRICSALLDFPARGCSPTFSCFSRGYTKSFSIAVSYTKTTPGGKLDEFCFWN